MPKFSQRLRRFLLDYGGPAPGAAAGGLALMIVGGFVEGAGLLLLVPILMVVSGSGGETAQRLAGVLSADPGSRLALLLALFGGLMLLRALVLHARDLHLARLNLAFVNRLRSAMLARLAAARWDRLAALPHGRITHLATGDVATSGAAAQGLAQAAAGAVMLAAQLAVAAILSPALVSFSLALLGLVALAARPLMLRAERAGAGLREAGAGLTGDLLQLLAGLKLTRAQNLEAQWIAELTRRQEEVGRHQLAFVAQRSVSQNAFNLFAAATAGAAVLVGYAVLELAPAVLLVMLVVLARIAGPALQVQGGVQLFVHHLPAFEALKRLDEELAADAPIAEGHARSLPAGPVQLDGVTYLHRRPGGSGEVAGVRGVRLTIAPGSLVGVTGPSGAGKTTLADLLVGLVRPQAGQVRIGDALLEPATLAAWRERLAYVGQDAVLFHDTIRRNLLWGAADGTDAAAIADALDIAGASELVARLEAGLETVVGERGSLVSGGERQRLALARALLRRPDLIILDEATNAVDEAAERAIVARLAALTPRPTIVLIAHRMVNLDLCDRLIRIEDGRIAKDVLQAPVSARTAAR